MKDKLIILQGVVGSKAYGLDTPDSDIDQLGVFLAPLQSVLGIHGPQSVQESHVTHEPDLTLHEAGKFVKLALSANPTILELLFLPEYTVKDDLGELLISNRKHFLSTKNVKARYGGYVKAQTKRLLRRNDEDKDGFSSDTKARTAKHGRHCYRLLIQGAQLLSTGEIEVNVASYRDLIFDAGYLAVEDPQEFAGMVDNVLAEFDKASSILPDEPNEEEINRLLIAMRWSTALCQ